MAQMNPSRRQSGTTHRFPMARALRAVRIQCLCRDVNDVIAERGGQFLCECSNKGCQAVLSTSHREYDAVRRMPTWFIVAPGHYDTLVDRVVESRQGYDLIEKFDEGGLAATRLYRRVRSAHASPDAA